MRTNITRRLDALEAAAPPAPADRHCDLSIRPHPCSGDCPGKDPDNPSWPNEQALWSYLLGLFSHDLHMTPTGIIPQAQHAFEVRSSGAMLKRLAGPGKMIGYWPWEEPDERARWYEKHGEHLEFLQGLFRGGRPFVLLTSWAARAALAAIADGWLIWREVDTCVGQPWKTRRHYEFKFDSDRAKAQPFSIASWDAQNQNIGLARSINNQFEIWYCQDCAFAKSWHESGDVDEVLRVLEHIASC